MSRAGLYLVGALTLALAGCASQPPVSSSGGSKTPSSRGGGYYQNDGPPEDENIDLDAIADAVPRDEPPSRYGNPDSYEALGKTYYVLPSAAGFTQTGRASWYGKQFHGRRTSSGEPYNMYKMTAAHKRLPVPSYVRVTNTDNGKSAIVRVNDRGPFHDGRIIDLSYVAARKLDIVARGSAPVRIETVTPDSLKAERTQTNRSPEIANRGASAQRNRSARPSSRDGASASAAASDTSNTPGRAIPVANRMGASNTAETADSGLYLQAGAFGEANNARRLRDKLRNAGFQPVAIVTPSDTTPLYRVRVGPFDNPRSRALSRQILVEQGFAVRAVDR